MLTVSELNNLINLELSSSEILSGLMVTGEISSFKRHFSGHLYFTLKDANSSIDCVMFKGSTYTLDFAPADGDKVIITGRISIYEKSARLQLYAVSMKKSGSGELFEKFLRLKARFEENGYFSPENKKPIPKYPEKIALITSAKGAALRDFVKVYRTSGGLGDIKLFSSHVQGDLAANEVTRRLREVEKSGNFDVVVITRGGGSYEDLGAFNDERLALEAFDANTPLISAIGHETDFTILDFISDKRAATPSEAASILAEGFSRAEQEHENAIRRIKSELMRQVLIQDKSLESVNFALASFTLDKRISESEAGAYDKAARIRRLLEDGQRSLDERIRLSGVHAANANPLKILEKGYAAVEKGGVAVSSVDFVEKGDEVKIRFSDGYAVALVEEVKNG